MNYWDYILLGILAFFIYNGFRSGFVRLIGGFIGIVIGAWLAGRYYDVVAAFLIEQFSMPIVTALVVGFVAIYIGANLIVGLVSFVLTKVFHFIPLATSVNRLVGAVIGMLEGLILVGIVVWIITLFPFRTQTTELLRSSRVAGYFTFAAQVVQPLLPSSLRNIDYDMLDGLSGTMDQKMEYLKGTMPSFIERLQRIQSFNLGIGDLSTPTTTQSTATTTR